MHQEHRAREGFARGPKTPDPAFWGKGVEEEEQEKSKSSRRESLGLGRLARAAAVGILSFGAVAYPSWPVLAKRAGLSMPELRRGLAELTRLQLVQVIPPGPESERLSNEYRCSATLKTLLGYETDDGDKTDRRPRQGVRDVDQAASCARTPGRCDDSGDAAASNGGVPGPDAPQRPEGDVHQEPTEVAGAAPVAGPLTASIRDILSRVADGAPVEVVTPAPRCPALAADEDDCASGWHSVIGSRSVRRCGAVQATKVAARKEAPKSVSEQQTPLAPPPRTRTPEQHRTEAAVRRQRRQAGESLFAAVAEVVVAPCKVADLDGIAERARDATGAWTVVVGYLFPTEAAAARARGA